MAEHAERSRPTYVLWGSQEGGLGYGSLYITKSLARARWAPGWTFWGGTPKISLTSSPSMTSSPPTPDQSIQVLPRRVQILKISLKT